MPPPPSRERLAELIEALGNPQDPDHGNSLDEFVRIGPAAIPALAEAIDPQRPWLLAYRATEALGRIGDGRAAGPLVQALRHPNSNVRWSAVHSLAQIGDLRALLELRRVANEDQGKTSWGESVAETAQSALDGMRAQSMWGQSVELLKTAATSVVMILSLILAFSIVTTLRSELASIGQVSASEVEELQAEAAAALAIEEPEAAAVVDPTPEPAPTATPEPPDEITGTVLQSANVRPAPNVNNQPIGSLRQNDQIIFLARTPNSQWYLVELGTRVSDNSFINGSDARGWVNQALLTPPEADVPVQDEAEASSTTEP